MNDYFALAAQLLISVCSIIAANKLTAYRIQQLEKKVDKHNTIIERVYKLEQRVDDFLKGRNKDEA